MLHESCTDYDQKNRKRREARQKMLQRLQTDENSPASSPSHQSPLLDRIKEKNRVSSRDSASTPKRERKRIILSRLFVILQRT